MADEINDELSARRRKKERSIDDNAETESPGIPPGVVAAGLAAGVVAVGIVGWLIYRSRRRANLLQQMRRVGASVPDSLRGMRAAIPDAVRELPQGVREQIRRMRG